MKKKIQKKRKTAMRFRLILEPSNNRLKLHSLPLRRNTVNKKYAVIIGTNAVPVFK